MVEVTIEKIIWLAATITILAIAMITTFTPYIQQLIATHKVIIKGAYALYNTTTNKIEVYVDIRNIGNIAVEKVVLKVGTLSIVLEGTPIEPNNMSILKGHLPALWTSGTQITAHLIITYSDEHTETKILNLVIEQA